MQAEKAVQIERGQFAAPLWLRESRWSAECGSSSARRRAPRCSSRRPRRAGRAPPASCGSKPASPRRRGAGMPAACSCRSWPRRRSSRNAVVKRSWSFSLPASSSAPLKFRRAQHQARDHRRNLPASPDRPGWLAELADRSSVFRASRAFAETLRRKAAERWLHPAPHPVWTRCRPPAATACPYERPRRRLPVSASE